MKLSTMAYKNQNDDIIDFYDEYRPKNSKFAKYIGIAREEEKASRPKLHGVVCGMAY